MEVSQPPGLSWALMCLLPFPRGAVGASVGPMGRCVWPFQVPWVPGLSRASLAAVPGQGSACLAGSPTTGWPRALQQPGMDQTWLGVTFMYPGFPGLSVGWADWAPQVPEASFSNVPEQESSMDPLLPWRLLFWSPCCQFTVCLCLCTSVHEVGCLHFPQPTRKLDVHTKNLLFSRCWMRRTLKMMG